MAGSFGLGIAAFLASIVAAGIIALLFTILSPLGTAGTVTAIGISVVLAGSIVVAFATLDGIYKAALYNYAATGQVPALFTNDVITGRLPAISLNPLGIATARPADKGRAVRCGGRPPHHGAYLNSLSNAACYTPARHT